MLIFKVLFLGCKDGLGRGDGRINTLSKKNCRCFEDPRGKTRSPRHQVEEVLMKRHDETELNGHQSAPPELSGQGTGR